MSMQEFLARDDQAIAQVYFRDPVVMERGEGVFLYDIEGKRYLDFSAHYSSCCLGHSNKKLITTIEAQMSKLISVSAQFSSMERIYLAEKLLSLTNGKYAKVLFGCTGSDAIEFAIKAVKHHKKGGNIITFWRGYHGATAGSAAATGKAETIQIDENISDLLPGGFIHVSPPYCYRCDYEKKYPDCDLFCLKYIKKRVAQDGCDNIAGVIIEPVQAAGGVIIPPEGYMEKLKQLCEEMNSLLIFDEVVTGIGRTGTMFAYEHWGIYPDILVAGKALTGGYIPGSAVLMKKDIAESMDKLTLHGHTHSAYPLMCASVLANLKIIEQEKLCDNAHIVGKLLHTRLLGLKSISDKIGDVRGIGLLQGIEIVYGNGSKKADFIFAEKLYRNLLKAGVITELESSNRLESSVLVLHPPLILTKEQAEEAVEIIRNVLINLSK